MVAADLTTGGDDSVRATCDEARGDGGKTVTSGGDAGDDDGDDDGGDGDGGEARGGDAAVEGGEASGGGEARGGDAAVAGDGEAGDVGGDGGDGGAAAAPRGRRRRSRVLVARVAMACTTNGMYDIALQRATAARYRGRLEQRSCMSGSL